MKPLRFGGLSIHPPVLSAPMAGYTDAVYREILREHGCPYCYTEMVSAKGLLMGGEASAVILRHSDSDAPLAVQLFGYDPEDMARAAAAVGGFEPGFECIDINLGCPASKIASQGSGGSLLKDLSRAGDIVRAVKSVSKVPVTAKTRLGWDDPGDCEKIASTLAEAGVDMLCVHGRTVSQGYSGKADWAAIRRAAAAVSLPVVGNGDIFSAQDALERLSGGSDAGIAGVMVGRGLLGNPAFFHDLLAAIDGRPVITRTPSQKMKMAAGHFRRSLRRYGEIGAVLEMRKHLAFYVKGIRGAPRLRERIMGEKSAESVLELLTGGWKDIV